MRPKGPEMRLILKQIKIFLLAVLCALLLAACGEDETISENQMQVYYLSNSETKVEMHPYEMQTNTPEEQLLELLECLQTTPEKREYKAPLDQGFRVQDIICEDGKLQLDMDEAYLALKPITEILTRAAIVRTLSQLETVNLVQITVNGGLIYDTQGNPVNWMSADQFIDNDGNEINTFELARIKLYFASEDGTSLLAAYREKHYSSNTPIERLVVDELLAGPSGQVAGLYASINPATKVINITTKDGICYVNLSEDFLTVVNNVPTEISIYSIVNSLAELSTVNKVQILINGETPSSFSASTFERNLDIVTAWEN